MNSNVKILKGINEKVPKKTIKIKLLSYQVRILKVENYYCYSHNNFRKYLVLCSEPFCY